MIQKYDPTPDMLCGPGEYRVNIKCENPKCNFKVSFINDNRTDPRQVCPLCNLVAIPIKMDIGEGFGERAQHPIFCKECTAKKLLEK